MMYNRFAFLIFVMGTCAGSCYAGIDNIEYTADLSNRVWPIRSGWGFTGINTAWVAYGLQSQPIQMGGKEYSGGLGSITTGEIVVSLEGKYSTFQCDIGIQDGFVGGGIFRILADGCEVFNSGSVNSGDAVRHISIPVDGVNEMRLLVDRLPGMKNYTSANWANAQLAKSSEANKQVDKERVDIARFARVVTSDPNRTDGARANRLEEFRADDVFLETDLPRNKDDSYIVPAGEGGRGSIGLVWSGRRQIRKLELQFDGGNVPSPESVVLQCWVRTANWPEESQWQGKWEPLEGKVDRKEDRLVWSGLDRNPNGLIGTQKVRWIFSSPPVTVKNLSAWTNSDWEDTELLLQIEKPMQGKHADIEVYNGEILKSNSDRVLTHKWNPGETICLKIRYGKPNWSKADRTVLRFRLPDGAFGVAIDDVLANGGVYVKDFGLYVKPVSGGLTLDEYRKKFAGQKTVLQRVREMPDQTFSQALKNTRTIILDRDFGPTVLSLPCENHKYLVGRNGAILVALPNCDFPPKYMLDIKPTFGSGACTEFRRTMHGGWMPISEISFKDGGLIHRQRIFVSPFGQNKAASKSPWLGMRPLCISQIDFENPQAKAINLSYILNFEYPIDKNAQVKIMHIPKGFTVDVEGRSLVVVRMPADSYLTADVKGNVLHISGSLPAGVKTGIAVYIPGWDMDAQESASMPDVKKALRDTKEYWKRIMRPAMQFDIPDPLLENVIMASQVHCLIASRSTSDGLIAPWIGATDYPPLDSEAHSIIQGMDGMGHCDYALKSLQYYIDLYNSLDYLSHGYTLIATGWHLWSLAEHYDLTGDSDWLKGIAPKIFKVCEWITDQRRKTMRSLPDSSMVPEYGLMPPGVVADWGAYGYTFAQNGYFFAGLNNASRVLADIDYPGTDKFLMTARRFRSDIMRAYNLAQSQSPVLRLQDGRWVPGYPMQLNYPGLITDFFPDDNMFLTRLYDVELGAHHLVHQGVLEADSRECNWMIDHMEDEQFLNPPPLDSTNRPLDKLREDWFDMGGYASMQTAYCHNMEISTYRDDVKPFIRSYFNSIGATLNIENLSFSENTYAYSSMNKTHTTGEFLRRTRLMFIIERDNDLWLAPFITNNWLKDGKTVSVANAPTSFGNVSYRIKSYVNDGYIKATIDPPARRSPGSIILRLRHPEGQKIQSIKVTGATAEISADGESIHIKQDDSNIAIIARFDKGE